MKRLYKTISVLLLLFLLINNLQIVGVKANEQSVNEQSVNEQSVNEQSVNEQSVNEQSVNEQSVNEQSVNEIQKFDLLNKKIYEEKNYKIELEITNSWGNKANVNVTVRNTGNEVLHNWAVKFQSDWKISNSWCADINLNDNGYYIAVNQGYNSDVNINSETVFGFEIEYSGDDLLFPEVCLLDYCLKEVESKKVDITYSVESEWENGYIGYINITNNSTETIKEWQLEFDFKDSIETIWNAYKESVVDGHYIIKNADFNQNINPGETIKIGLQSQCKKSDNVPSNFILKCIEPIEKQLCTVSFDLNYDGAVNNIEEIQVIPGDCCKELAEPVREGYKFNGWYFDPECTQSFCENYDVIENDTILYAGWINYTEVDSKALDELTIGFAQWDSESAVTKDVILPKTLGAGISIRWESSNPDVISENGKVCRPEQESVEVNLTASISAGDITVKKNFLLKVIKTYQPTKEQLQDYDMEDLVVVNDGEVPRIIMQDDDEVVRVIQGCFSDIVIETPEEALLALNNVKTLIGCKNPEEQLEISNVVRGEYSTKYEFQQVYEGYRVCGISVSVVVNLNGKAKMLINTFAKEIKAQNENEIHLSKDEIISSVNNLIDTEEVKSVNDLIIYAKGNQQFVFAYEVVTQSKENNSIKHTYFVDASTGELLNYFNDEQNIKEVACGIDLLDVEHNDIQCERLEDNTVVLDDKENHITIYTRGGDEKTPYLKDETRVMTDELLNGKYHFRDPEAISAYKNTLAVKEFYEDIVHRKYFRSELSSIDVVIHDPDIKDNASWIPNRLCISFGDSHADFPLGYMAYLEIVAHEYTHGVFGDIVDLSKLSVINQRFWGDGLNEGNSDIFGNLIQGYYSNNIDWIMLDASTNEGQRRNAKNEEWESKLKFDKNGDILEPLGKYNFGTVINHAMYLMSDKIDISKMANLWYQMFLTNSQFDNDFKMKNLVEFLLSTADDMYMTLEEKQCIIEAFEAIGIHTDENKIPEGTCSFKGTIVEADKDLDMSNNKPLVDVKVETGYKINNQQKNTEIVTDSNGSFELKNILPMKYTMQYTKEGYLPEIEYVQFDTSKTTMFNSIVELIPKTYDGKGSASGFIKDATTAKGIEGLTLTIRKGINNKNGDIVKSDIKTSESGYYKVENLNAGNYCIEVKDNRINEDINIKNYICSYFNIKILGGENIEEQNTTVTDKIDNDSLRIVLEWDTSVPDLDSHLEYFDDKDSNKNYHIYYSNPDINDGEKLVANLDVDDTTYEGPETTTVFQRGSGKYVFYVYNYSGYPRMSDSNAVVYLYYGSKEYKYTIPKGTEGLYWTVFSIDAKTNLVTTIQKVGTSVSE